MNIYYINEVVIARGKKDAPQEADLGDQYNSEILINLIEVCANGVEVVLWNDGLND